MTFLIQPLLINQYVGDLIMQLTYAFVYYFLILFIILTFSLIIFALRPLRKLLHKLQTKFQNILNHSLWTYTINFSFAVIFIILIDSFISYYAMNQHFKEHEHAIGKIGLERMDVLKTGQSESLMGMLKEHREYYLAERNIMLTCSALFVYFVFQRLVFNIRKLADEENRREHPEDKSVILQILKLAEQSNAAQAGKDKKE